MRLDHNIPNWCNIAIEGIREPAKTYLIDYACLAKWLLASRGMACSDNPSANNRLRFTIGEVFFAVLRKADAHADVVEMNNMVAVLGSGDGLPRPSAQG